MPNPPDERFISAITDGRLWRTAGMMVSLMEKVKDNGCDCNVCVELRGIGGAIDDIQADHQADT